MKKIPALILACSVLMNHAGAQCPAGDISLWQQAQVDNFPATCSSVDGNVYIYGNVSNLAGLSHITSISGNLSIYQTSMTTFSGLSQLEHIGGDLYMYQLPSTSITALGKPGGLTIGRDLYIYNNQFLAGIDGLSTISSVGRDVYIYQNNALTGSKGLEGITSIGRDLKINRNPLLQDFNGLKEVTQIGRDIEVYQNPALLSIEGLAKLASLSGSLNVFQNPGLASCAVSAFCSAFDGPPGQVNIFGNAEGCNSVGQVESACDALPVTLLYFRAVPESSMLRLSWATTAESNCSRFEILGSDDGVNWEKAGSVTAVGKSVTLQKYEFSQFPSGAPSLYYRLKIVDHDNSFSYSKIISIEGFSAYKAIVYPNPAKEVFFIRDGGRGIREVSMHDANGRLIFRQTAGPEYRPGAPAPGVYRLSISFGDGWTEYSRVVLSP
ncbi:MAG: hypothetical protein ABS46_04515 [Cytophagaceae bacterium SCN 52-12]|nr:MAG: hypothetical protein ABS46_04515 [Cytophagaceae bacterium SCN 52-12]